MPHKSARSRRDRKYVIGAIALLAVVVAAVGAIFFAPKEEELDAKLCPVSGIRGHVVLLVDQTDPFTFTQQAAVLQLVESLSDTGQTPPGTLLSVYLLGDDFRDNAVPEFERCNPGTGNEKNEWTHNIALWKKRFEKEFEGPLRQRVPQMSAKQPAEHSPILQMLQLVSLKLETDKPTIPKRLVIISDLLQNTPELSLYRQVPDYSQFRELGGARRLRADLKNVDVEVHLLLNTPQLENRRLLKFWEDYFSDMGARLSKVVLMPG